ncbi:MAG: hypothetical protein DI523_30560 [Paraburkholderia fungorum]|nr:MAG: hypothetical protein DI523_30560 [Paraburkholderia fungorum]
MHSAVLPAVTPDRATDFFGLKAPAFGVLLSASLIISSPTAGLRSCGDLRAELVLTGFNAVTGENGSQ